MEPQPEPALPDLFADALALEPDARRAFLDEIGARSPALRAELESLLAVHPTARRLFDHVQQRASVEQPPPDPAARLVGTRVGAYRITGLIASGGMGSVYVGERIDEAFRKQVAIKLVRPGLWNPDILQRFRTERQVLADLEHPGIARLIDGGSTPEGHPYLVMEFVDGIAVDRYCVENHLPLRARLDLFLEICDAVAYAHRNLVIHRDLKPSNILVEPTGRMKLLDFGIAKVLGVGAETGAETVLGLQPLTPRYASPEQIAGRRMTTSTDIYSLGIVLYELVTETLPYDLDGASAAATARIVTQQQPVRPSRRPGPFARALAGDLDTILLKALQKEPERRYASVPELADDIRRQRAGLPVHARPDTASYRISKFVRRHKALVGSTLAVVGLLAAALGVTLDAYRRAADRTRDAEWQAYVASLTAAESSILRDEVGDASTSLQAAPAHLRGWEWNHLRARLDRSRLSFRAHDGKGVTRLALSADGDRLLTASMDSTLKEWSTSSGQLVRTYGPFASTVESAAFVRGGDVAAIGLGDGSVLLLDRNAGGQRVLQPPGHGWAQLCADAGGDLLACGFFDGTAMLWSLPDAALLGDWRAEKALVVAALTADGSRLVTAGADGRVAILDTRTLRPIHAYRGHDRRVYTIAVSADGKRLATGSMDRTAKVWDLETGALVSTFRDHRGTITSLAFHPDGDRVVSASADNRLLVWDAATGGVLDVLRGHRADVFAIAARADGAALVTGDWAGEVRVWGWEAQDIRSPRMALERWRVPPVMQAALAGSEAILAAAWDMPTLLLWNIADLAPQKPINCYYCSSVACAADGKTLVAANKAGRLWAFDTTTWSADSIVAHPGPILAVAVDPQGERIATAGEDSTIKLWSLRSLRLLATLRNDAGVVHDVEFSPDGKALAAGGADRTIRLWDAEAARELAVLRGHAGPVLDVAFDSSGRRLASSAADRTIRVWDVDVRAEQSVIEARAVVNCVAWAPDGTRLVAGGDDAILRFFDPVTEREIVGLHGHSGRILSLRFRRDGMLMISTSADGTVKIWDGEPVRRDRGAGGG